MISSIGQVFGSLAVVGARGDADAGIYRDLLARQVKRLLQAGENSPRSFYRSSASARILRKQDRELISAQPRNKRVLGRTLTQTPADGNEQRIASRMSKRVIDGLEAVEVDKENGAIAPSAPNFSKCIAGKFKEHPAIWQASQNIHPRRLESVTLGGPSVSEVTSRLNEGRDKRSEAEEDDQREKFVELPFLVPLRKITDGIGNVEVR